MLSNKFTKKLFTFLILFYAMSSILIPSASIKKVIFIIIIALYFLINDAKITNYNSLIVVLFIFLYGFLISFFFESDINLSKQFFFSSTILFLIIPINKFNIDMDKIIKFLGILFIIFSFVIIIYETIKYSLPISGITINIFNFFYKFIPIRLAEILEDYNEVAVGLRYIFSTSSSMVHLSSSPFIYLPICLWFEEWLDTKEIKNIIYIILAAICIFFSTSRALMMITPIICSLLYTMRHGKNQRFILLFLFLATLIYVVIQLTNNTVFLSTSEISNSTKIGGVISAFDNMSIFEFLFGNGLGSYYYSAGRFDFVAHTEVTFVDYCRYVGVPLAIVLYTNIILPTKDLIYLIKCNTVFKRLFLIFFGYIVISFTNPVLFNSIGTLVILWYWNKVYSYRAGVYNE